MKLKNSPIPSSFQLYQFVSSVVVKPWVTQLNLTSPPIQIWVNVDFGIDFKFYNNLQSELNP
jgi:hypothetical protein